MVAQSPSSPLAGPSRADDATPHSIAQRAGVMARLHALFPVHTSEQPQGEVLRRPPRPPPKFLKVKVLTWNMHDSLPKGDLEDLLGPIQDREVEATVPGVIPDLPLDTQHPYHLIVVAGQECPSVSGLPMGIGAGFKLKDKERDRSKEKDKEKDKGEKEKEREKEKEGEKTDKETSRERPRSAHHSHHHHLSGHLSVHLHEHDKGKDPEDDRRRAHHLSLRRHRQSEEDDLSASASTSAHELLGSLHHTYGWTSMLEDWFCHAGQLATAPHHGSNEFDDMSKDSDDVPMSPKAKSTGDLNGRIQSMNKGPYELLIKERMMGLYLVIFIKRECRHLIRGMSKSSVTAGLIGGRVGNKGGVGISINFNGTTLLFLNAHLAAHEGKVQHRLANLAKIKAELNVDTFLPPDDPRMMAEDITDRFDFAFICGDLNFRLDITRLHADWLISRRDYAQALAFDQLRKVMQDGEAFVGFNEATIDFPPTFKYDVLRPKRSKHRHSKRISKTPIGDAAQHDKLLAEIEERRHEIDEEQVKSEEEPELDADGEAVSVASTSYTRYTIDGDDPEKEKYDYFLPAASPRATASTGNLVNKVLYSSAAHKAKAKWVSLVSSAVPHTPIRKWTKFPKPNDSQSTMSNEPPLSPTILDPSPPATVPPTPDPSDSSNGKDPMMSETSRLGVPPLVGGRTSSTRSTAKSDERDEDGEEKFNYDSSHKQRVPSWCDRILWKTTVDPGPEEGEDEPELEPPAPARNRMGTLLHALRPASLRGRRDSVTSVEVTPTSPHAPDDFGASRSGQQEPDRRNSLDRATAITIPRTLSHSHSIDTLPSPDRAYMSRSKSHMPLRDETRARKPSLPSIPNFRSPPAPLPSSPLQQDRFPRSSTMATTMTPPKELLPSPAPVTSLWRNFSFLPFLSKDAIPPNIPPDRPPTPETPPPPPPRRGDVVCLSYDTLDDVAMRHLQAKSDHRPVIGSYALYI